MSTWSRQQSCSFYTSLYIYLFSLTTGLFHDRELSSPPNQCYVTTFSNHLNLKHTICLRVNIHNLSWTKNSVPLLLIEATYNHAQAPLPQLNGKATGNPDKQINHNLMEFIMLRLEQMTQRSIYTFGSKNTTGFGSRMHDNNNPFAWLGLRGITTYRETTLEENFKLQGICYLSKILLQESSLNQLLCNKRKHIKSNFPLSELGNPF